MHCTAAISASDASTRKLSAMLGRRAASVFETTSPISEKLVAARSGAATPPALSIACMWP
jgi:hypothetical protein